MALFHCRQLLLLQFNDFLRVALIQFNLSLAQRLILGEVLLVLALEIGDLLRELLHLICRLSMNVLGKLLVLCLSSAFQSLNLVLQLLVLILQLRHLLCINLAGRTGIVWASVVGPMSTALSIPSKLCSQLRVLLHFLLVLSVELFILGNHTLLIFEHLVEVFKLLGQEDCLIANNRVNAIQILQIKKWSGLTNMLMMAPKYRPLEISSNLRCGVLGRPGASPGTSTLGRSASRFSRSESPTRQPLARRRRRSWPRQL